MESEALSVKSAEIKHEMKKAGMTSLQTFWLLNLFLLTILEITPNCTPESLFHSHQMMMKREAHHLLKPGTSEWTKPSIRSNHL